MAVHTGGGVAGPGETMMVIVPENDLLVVDQPSGACFHVARIKIPAEALKDLGGRLVPGMPLEVFISTGEPTVRSCPIKLLRDQIMHTFREN